MSTINNAANDSRMNLDEPINALIGDLTFMFFANKILGQKLNYPLLDRALKWKFGLDKFDVSEHYTLFDETNSAQKHFVDVIEKLDWNVNKVSLSEMLSKQDYDSGNTRINLPSVRFTTDLMMWLGMAVNNYDRVFVITDAWVGLFRGALKILEQDPDLEINILTYQDDQIVDTRYFSNSNKIDPALKATVDNQKIKVHDISSIMREFRNSGSQEYLDFQDQYLKDNIRNPNSNNY